MASVLTSAPGNFPGVPSYNFPQPSGGGQIGGQLPFAQMGATNTLPSDPASLGAHYTSAYNSALGMNSSNYSNILAGYQQTMAQQQSAQGAIGAGYTGLYNDVLGQLAHQGGEQRQQINSDYAANLGHQSQQLIDRGLGNSTIQASVGRGLEFDRARAGNALEEQLGRQNADYMSNLGLQGLGYRDRANMQNTQLATNQLGWMNSVMAPYPDAGSYASLAQQYGATAEAQRQRSQLGRNGYPGAPPTGTTMSGQYGKHFSNDFSGGPGAAPVQLGGGGGGTGGGIDGRQAIGLGGYYTPGTPGGGSGDLSAYGQAVAGAAGDAWGQANDPFSYENYGQYVSPAAGADYSAYGQAAGAAGLEGYYADPLY